MAVPSKFKQSDDPALQEAIRRSLQDEKERLLIDRAGDADLQKAMALSIAEAEARFSAGPRDQGGLYNLGNTCYMNAMIQTAFNHNTKYREALETLSQVAIPKPIPEDEKKEYYLQLKQQKTAASLFIHLLNLSQTAPENKDDATQVNEAVKTALETLLRILGQKNPAFLTGAQQDPSDFFQTLCQVLGFDPDFKYEYNPEIEKLLPCGRILTHIVPTSDLESGGEVSSTVENASSLILAHKETESIQDGLDRQFMSPALMSGTEQLTFNGPNEGETQRLDAYKTDFLSQDSIPDEILIQAPRFSSRKVFQKSFFGRVASVETVRERNNKAIHFEDRIAIPLYDKTGQEATKFVIMELVSVCAHISERLNSGHYVSYRRQQDGRYTLYNDSRVTPDISSDEAHEHFKKEGYIAVYRKVEVKDLEPSSGVRTINTCVPGMNPVITMSSLSGVEIEDDLSDQSTSSAPIAPSEVVSTDHFLEKAEDLLLETPFRASKPSPTPSQSSDEAFSMPSKPEFNAIVATKPNKQINSLVMQIISQEPPKPMLALTDCTVSSRPKGRNRRQKYVQLAKVK